MVSASVQLITARSGTLVNSAIFRRSPSGRRRSVRQSRMSGWIPIERSSLTECCVGFVLSSPEAPMKGTSVRWMNIDCRSPSSIRICRMVSRKGSDSMSPTVPPISTRHTSESLAPLPDARLELVGDVRNDLDGVAEVFAAPFLAQHVPVDLACGEVVPPAHGRADKSFVVAEIEIGLRTVVGDEHLPVLKRVHGPGVDVDVGIQLDQGDAKSPGLEDCSERCGGDPLAE